MYYDSAGLMWEKGPKLTPDKCQIWVTVALTIWQGTLLGTAKEYKVVER